MKVNTSSWHFRLNNWLNDGKWNYGKAPRSLCAYFWSTVWTFVSLCAMFVVFPVVVLFVVVGFLFQLVHSWLHTLEYMALDVFLMGAFFSLSGMVFYTVQLVVNIKDWYRQSHPRKLKSRKPYTHKETKPKVQKEPNILWEYLKAVKQKACPTIEYIGDKA